MNEFNRIEYKIRNMKKEYGVLINDNYEIYAYTGTNTNLSITDRSLDNVLLTHNHPEIDTF